MNARRSGGYTLLECLVVIAILVLLGVILIPYMRRPRGHPPTIMNNGRNIYVSLFAKGLENPLDPSPVWPQERGALNLEDKAATFPDSTEYFTWMVTAGVLNVDFAFFSGPGMPAARTTDPSRFTAAHNAWAITLGVNDETKDETPVLFSANFSTDPKKFAPLRSLDQTPYLARDAKPFGDRGGVVIWNGGAATVLKPDTLTSERFNPPGATNACLYPSAR